MTLRVNWGHASAPQHRRVPADSGGGNKVLSDYADKALEQREACRALDEAPHSPLAGKSTVSTPNDKLRADLSFLDDLIALRAIDVFSNSSRRIPVRSKDPQEVWGALSSFCIGIFGQPRCKQMMREVNGDMKFGRISVQRAALRSNFRR